jgi:hypothetical protein
VSRSGLLQQQVSDAFTSRSRASVPALLTCSGRRCDVPPLMCTRSSLVSVSFGNDTRRTGL